MKFLFALAFMVVSVTAYPQQNNGLWKEKFNVGFEADVLPYVTGGYYGSVWAGYRHIRYRVIVAHIQLPQFSLPDGFTDNEIETFTIAADYFFKNNFKGWWIGAGFEYWKGVIQTKTHSGKGYYDNTLFTIGYGYVFKLYKNFYVNPWAGGHLRLTGDESISVKGKEFTPADVIIQVSVKLGWHF